MESMSDQKLVADFNIAHRSRQNYEILVIIVWEAHKTLGKHIERVAKEEYRRISYAREQLKADQTTYSVKPRTYKEISK